MPLTFEERISEDLDALYSGAAFLSGSQGEGAQKLLVDAVSRASAEFRDDGDPGAFTPWMEGILVQTLLASDRGKVVQRSVRGSVSPTVTSHALNRIGWGDMVRAAASIPARPRAALWLTLLRRWRYSDTAETLGIDITALRDLLDHRAAFLKEVVGGSGAQTARGTGS